MGPDSIRGVSRLRIKDPVNSIGCGVYFPFLKSPEYCIHPSPRPPVVVKLISPEQEGKGSFFDIINFFPYMFKRHAFNIFSDADDPKDNLVIDFHKPFVGNNQKTAFPESKNLCEKPYNAMKKTQNHPGTGDIQLRVHFKHEGFIFQQIDTGF
jgi:hypothetical protein